MSKSIQPKISMFDTICTLPLTSDLFAQAIHPSEPLVAVGLAAGHVQTFKLPPVASDNSSDEAPASENGFGQIETVWRTRRHKGSCRCLAFSINGETLYSAGTDGIVKAATIETGQVISKIAVPTEASTEAPDAPCLLHALSPQTLLLATDSSALHLYDLRVSQKLEGAFGARRPQQTHHPHDDYVSSLTPLPPSAESTSGFSKQWVSTGGSTLAITDLRRGVLVRSEDQEEELLSSLYVGGLPARGTSRGEKVLVGGSDGVLTLWEKGAWDDQDERIYVDRTEGQGESLDVLTLVPEGIGPSGKIVAAGLGDGRVKFVHIGKNKVIDELRHDMENPVSALGFDTGGRMISGGGQIVKVWHDKAPESEDGEADGVLKRAAGSEDEDEEEESGAESCEDEKAKKRRKRRKRAKGKDKSGGKNAILAFKGLD